jgi:glutamate--cysteine ligase
MEERLRLRAEVPRLGLQATVAGRSVRDIARDVLDIAHEGLKARNRNNAAGDNETGFLGPLLETVESGKTPAERKLELYHGRWDHSVDPVFEAFAY